VRGVAGFLLVWMVINYLAGAGLFGQSGDAEIAWEAHIGGLVTGFFLIGVLDNGRQEKLRDLSSSG
jgi:membrane associated rhomboid family serine protease